MPVARRSGPEPYCLAQRCSRALSPLPHVNVPEDFASRPAIYCPQVVRGRAASRSHRRAKRSSPPWHCRCHSGATTGSTMCSAPAKGPNTNSCAVAALHILMRRCTVRIRPSGYIPGYLACVRSRSSLDDRHGSASHQVLSSAVTARIGSGRRRSRLAGGFAHAVARTSPPRQAIRSPCRNASSGIAPLSSIGSPGALSAMATNRS
jgi:hypothetical protein